MSGSYPLFPRLLRSPATRYDDSNPVSVWEALVLRSNAQLLVGSTTQVPVCWRAPGLMGEATASNVYYFTNATGAPMVRTWSHEFVHTWPYTEWPAGLEVEAIAQVGTGGVDDLELQVRIVPASSAPGDLGAEAIFHDAELTSGALTAATVSGLVMFDERYAFDGKWLGLSVDEDGAAVTTYAALMRIECQLTIPDDDYGFLYSVQVREFACLP